ncbi:hypothetical protein [Bradyrhizobium sp. CB1015]|uniref:hypothetical protein n=1 Tax=Bradyrhizobium sp. CB1015 TaxID=2976822 RepID=UPI0021AA3C7C|nr:hypothetical protein [Bradyrhizobium sp. CB1015]UWU95941.1 hypothetical protein N2604_09990 [Bradyrhizobium sp. CB1015]
MVTELEKALAEARTFCTAAGVDVDLISTVKGLERTKLIGQAVEALIAPDDRRRGFFRVVGATVRAYKALLPDERAAPYLKPVATLHVVAEAMEREGGQGLGFHLRTTARAGRRAELSVTPRAPLTTRISR